MYIGTNVCMYVFMYVCMYVCMYVILCTYVCASICLRVSELTVFLELYSRKTVRLRIDNVRGQI